ncbi:MAG: 2,3-bisphosphoglycerate-independent phosphoglycerate mutase [Epsilonproteobacteria bacterium]|nr:2,3-bisphosphoglycerate-independent phosphoglycerate mutase [Campylobacterota bacterium]
MAKKAILIITDGIGYKPNSKANAFEAAKKPTYDYLFKNVPWTLISTYGNSVGLPEGQMGNSEVGHMSIGSGRVLYQDLVKISLALKDGSLAKSKDLGEFFSKSNDIHIVGLVSDGGVHSHIEHIIGLAKIAKANGKRVWIHVITDGRDVSPTSSLSYIKQLKEIVDSDIKIASVAGRYYTMDRDNRWERVKRGYDAMVFATPKSSLDIEEYIEQSYKKDITDEFIEPVAFEGYEGMKDKDGVIMANFRSDRMREIVTALGEREFDKFDRKDIKLNIITMTQYDKSFDYPILFPKEPPSNTLAEVISRNNLSQLHTAETEKYAHVTFFFNGGIEEPYENESRVLINSPKVETYDMQPQMSAPEVGDAVVEGIESGYDFIVVNFANGDMVGHTGNYEAAIKAVEAVDKEIGKILEAAKGKDYNIVITSDHGNCEEMVDSNGEPHTQHTIGDVFTFVISPKVKELKEGGRLSNIAPTILELMELEVPKEMDESLIKA